MSLAEDNGVDTVLIPIGTSVSNANGSADLGTVVAVESHPHRILTIKDKQVIMTERNGYFDLYITVHGKASRREGEGLRMGDIRIAAGSVGDYFVGSFWAGNAKTASVRIL